MSGEWRNSLWGDLATLEYGKGLRDYENSNGAYRVFGTNGPIGRSSNPLCDSSTVIVGRKGAYRGIHYSPEPCYVIDTAFYLKTKSGFNMRWAYYQLLTQDINGMDSGSAIPSTSRDEFYHLPVMVPPLEEQKAIAHVLGTLDDKIELNRKTNETLEAMARASFKSWFVDFDPVKRNIARKAGQSQPSPLPSPNGRGRKGEGSLGYRGGYDFGGLIEIARGLRKKQTPAEVILWEMLRDKRFMGLKFRRQHQIGDYIADFYCHECKMVIELDGGIHSEKKSKDKKRDAHMRSLGLIVLRFSNDRVFNEPESIFNKILEACHNIEELSPSPYGRGRGEGGIEEFDALFPSEFQDSELGKIPKGWRVGNVGEEFKLVMGQSPPGDTYNEIGDGMPFFQGRTDFGFRYPAKRVFCTAPTRLADSEDTLVSVRAPVGDINMASEKCCIGRGVAAVRHKSASRSYTYYRMWSLSDAFAHFEGEGTVFGSIGKDNFKDIKHIVPPMEIIMGFEQLVFSIDQQIENNELTTSVIATIRDCLLPKLLSGELRIPETEKMAKANV